MSSINTKKKPFVFENSHIKANTDTDIHEAPSRSNAKSQQERRIDIQPAEDEDGKNIIYCSVCY